MSISRRDFGIGLTVSVASSASTLPREAAAQTQPHVGHGHDMLPAHWQGSEKIAFLIYPQFTALDMVGPHHMLGSLMGSTTYIVAKSKEPVVSDMKLAMVPSHTFADCPKDIDIICVPGGSEGTLAAMADAETIAFLRDVGSRAKYVTSVCTGSLVLGAAGLLRGYSATTHWGALSVLEKLGAKPVAERVVIDRNRITGAGVTAGLDFGLQLVSMLRDRSYAESVQLLAEYDPAPPFAAGSIRKAPKEPAEMVTAMLAPFADVAGSLAQQISASWN